MNPKIAFVYCSFLASAICLFAATQTSEETTGKKPWPRNREEAKDAVAAFTASLKKSTQDQAFRRQLTASCDSAKKAVSEEGNIDIPDDVVIMFYEPSTYEDHFAFYLPPLNREARTQYKYTDDEYFQCCSPSFRKFLLTPTLGAALNAAFTRAGYDPEFRKSLTVSCDSAKKAVSDEGHVPIKNEVQMIFHELKKTENEKYHVFSLPNFGEQDPQQYQYRKQFMCCYDVW
jgi:hypothetical protein